MMNKPSLSRRHLISMSLFAVAALTAGGAKAKELPIPSPDYTIPGSRFHGRDESRLDWGDDPRSGNVIFLSHCMLNQNARIIRAADIPVHSVSEHEQDEAIKSLEKMLK